MINTRFALFSLALFCIFVKIIHLCDDVFWLVFVNIWRCHDVYIFTCLMQFWSVMEQLRYIGVLEGRKWERMAKELMRLSSIGMKFVSIQIHRKKNKKSDFKRRRYELNKKCVRIYAKNRDHAFAWSLFLLLFVNENRNLRDWLPFI